jgi:hypothetical protein
VNPERTSLISAAGKIIRDLVSQPFRFSEETEDEVGCTIYAHPLAGEMPIDNGRLGTMSAESVSQIKRIIPLDDKLLASLQNLRRGTGMFFNLEYSRIPVLCVIPACRCFHGEESEL